MGNYAKYTLIFYTVTSNILFFELLHVREFVVFFLNWVIIFLFK